MRLAVLQGATFAALAPDLLALVAFAAVLLPLGLVAFRVALRKARRDGSLTQY